MKKAMKNADFIKKTLKIIQNIYINSKIVKKYVQIVDFIVTSRYTKLK